MSKHLSTRMDVRDIAIPFQALRHTSLAKLARRCVYYLAIGREGYPFVFQHVESGEEMAAAVSPHLYVHIPFCRSLCIHCPYNKEIFRSDRYGPYADSLVRELSSYLTRPDIPPIQTLYFGGGTPSMTPDLIRRVIRLAERKFAPHVEIGVEVHPRDATMERLGQLKAMRVNRISLGIETFDDRLLRRLGRQYSSQQAEQAIRQARNTGFECVDVNLIYGIPGQNVHDPVADAERCIALGVDHLSAYPLITFDHTALGKLVRLGRFTEYGARQRAQAQRAIAHICRSHGFRRTSVWSFTKANAAAYTTVTRESYLGFGAGAGSKVDGEFWFNTFSVDAYSQLATPTPAIRLRTSERFRRLHWLYWQIYGARIHPEEYRALFSREVSHDFKLLVVTMRALGWIRREGADLPLTERGAIWAHRIQMLFSLTFIDEVWTQCQREPWPQQIVLY